MLLAKIVNNQKSFYTKNEYLEHFENSKVRPKIVLNRNTEITDRSKNFIQIKLLIKIISLIFKIAVFMMEIFKL